MGKLRVRPLWPRDSPQPEQDGFVLVRQRGDHLVVQRLNAKNDDDILARYCLLPYEIVAAERVQESADEAVYSLGRDSLGRWLGGDAMAQDSTSTPSHCSR